MVAAAAAKISLATQLADNWFTRLDGNSDGSISIPEFTAAGKAYNQKMLTLNKEWAIMDKDGDGTVTKAELKTYFEIKYPPAKTDSTATATTTTTTMWNKNWHGHP